MPETRVFSCPCCGQRAPQERLEGGTPPFPLEAFTHVFGGKVRMSEEMREARKGMPFQRGSGPGRMHYEDLDVTDELRENFARRIRENESSL